MEKTKEFEISMIVSHENNLYTEDQISDMFIKWVEKNGMLSGGMIKEIK
jgi:hypothetical protein